MRALLFHCKNYGNKIGKLADRPSNVAPEDIRENEQSCEDCVVALITIEKGDNISINAHALADEIAKMTFEVKRESVVILPFAHLSNNLANSEDSLKCLDIIEKDLAKQKFKVHRSHFGSHKELLLDIYGHPGNARYREFYL